MNCNMVNWFANIFWPASDGQLETCGHMWKLMSQLWWSYSSGLPSIQLLHQVTWCPEESHNFLKKKLLRFEISTKFFKSLPILLTAKIDQICESANLFFVEGTLTHFTPRSWKHGHWYFRPKSDLSGYLTLIPHSNGCNNSATCPFCLQSNDAVGTNKGFKRNDFALVFVSLTSFISQNRWIHKFISSTVLCCTNRGFFSYSSVALDHMPRCRGFPRTSG